MFAKSNQVERWLDSIGADWKYRDSVPISKLEPTWMSKNPCRAPGKAILDVALSYGERMSAGEAAPPAIFMATPTGLSLLDGRQRVFGAESIGLTVFSGYELITPSDRLVRVITLGANAALNGVRASSEWVISEAVVFMKTHGASIVEAAKLAGVTSGTIETHLATMKVRESLVSQGVEPQVANGTLAALLPLVNETSALIKAHRAVEDSAATVPMVKALVEQMLKQPGQGRFVALDQWISLPEIQMRMSNRRGRKRLATEKAFTACRNARTVLKENSAAIASEIKESERKELAKLGGYIAGKIREITGGEFSVGV